jgi:hypothetical protein
MRRYGVQALAKHGVNTNAVGQAAQRSFFQLKSFAKICRSVTRTQYPSLIMDALR